MEKNKVLIDLGALSRNLEQVRGVVKSDAYGHGLVPVSKSLEAQGIDRLGVAWLSEALRLRQEGIGVPITLLGGIGTPEEAAQAVRLGLTPVLYDLSAAQMLASECAEQGRKVEVQIKVDTGMGRLGVSPTNLGSFLHDLGPFAENSLANSAGVMGFPEAHMEVVRPGIMLYGGLPAPGFRAPVPLEPVMHFRGVVLQVRDLPAGACVSYGRTYRAAGPRKIAVLSAGYGDGLPRRMSNRGYVLINGRRAPIIGTICMNLTVCDITEAGPAMPGDEAVFLGRSGNEIITPDQLARWAETISYEILCSIGLRHHRTYVS
ncbi:MAG: alanine racemase [Deltaproteobacteria bacterium]|nr:alanine racemase [Deltaproteobacteria bacterium]